MGDNIFYGGWFSSNLQKAISNAESGCATIFGCYVRDPKRFGVMELGPEQQVISVEEKPDNPKSHYAITGLYFYDSQVCGLAKQLKPSERGELEITDLNRLYLERDRLKAQVLGRGFAWMDTGTVGSLMEAAVFVQAVQERQGMDYLCAGGDCLLRRVDWQKELLEGAGLYGKSAYGEHLRGVARDMFIC